METEKQHRGPLPLISVSGLNITVKRRKSLRKRTGDGTTAGKITVMEMDPKEMAFVFAFEPHPIIFP